jgi:hypothetical protein
MPIFCALLGEADARMYREKTGGNGVSMAELGGLPTTSCVKTVHVKADFCR